MTNSGDAAETVVMSLYELTFMCIKNYWKGLINDIFLNETGRSVYFAVPVLCLLKKELGKMRGIGDFSVQKWREALQYKNIACRFQRAGNVFHGE